jgi:8-oxo-dGTP diphosphatase
MKGNHFYRGVNPTVDLIVINSVNDVLMIKRSIHSDACPGMLAFPGGFIDSKATEGEFWQDDFETPKTAALRELAEETNLFLKENSNLILIGEYEGNNRDSRDTHYSWSKTYAFLFQITKELFDENEENIKGLDDAEVALWINLHELRKMKLAFDHNQILEDAIKILHNSN